MKKTTLCFCLRENEILLAMKKRGFGAGKWNGYGGKVEVGETTKIAAVRELEEESGLIVAEDNLSQVATIHFYFDKELVFECAVFFIHEWANQPIETEEMRPQWYKLSEVPFFEMWAADALWLPIVLKGDKINAKVYFNNDGNIVEDFSYKLI